MDDLLIKKEMNIKEACKVLGIARKGVMKLIKTGQLKIRNKGLGAIARYAIETKSVKDLLQYGTLEQPNRNKKGKKEQLQFIKRR